MKPLPTPPVTGHTEAERMDNAVRKLFTVTKDDYLKDEAKRQRTRKKRAKSK